MPDQDTDEFKKFPEVLLEGRYTFVQNRLEGGAVYRGDNEYLRIGEKEITIAEEIHTRSLSKKGFPVPEVTGHGELNGMWYFIETSLGDDHYGEIFKREYETTGVVSEESFSSFVRVMKRYAQASFGPANRSNRSESLDSISHYDQTKFQYEIDPELFERLMKKAGEALSDVPVGLISGDLGPFNILPNGVIDFEFLHTGPLGYDLVNAPLIGYFFPDEDGYRHRRLFGFSSEQLNMYYEMVRNEALAVGAPDPTNYWNEFIFLKTIWAASRPRGYEKKPLENPERENFFSHFRYNILRYVIEMYEKDEKIQPVEFPEIGVSGRW